MYLTRNCILEVKYKKLLIASNYFLVLVGSNGIEPSTSRLSGVRSNHLSYEPIILELSKLISFVFPTLFLMYFCIQPLIVLNFKSTLKNKQYPLKIIFAILRI